MAPRPATLRVYAAPGASRGRRQPRQRAEWLRAGASVAKGAVVAGAARWGWGRGQGFLMGRTSRTVVLNPCNLGITPRFEGFAVCFLHIWLG